VDRRLINKQTKKKEKKAGTKIGGTMAKWNGEKRMACTPNLEQQRPNELTSPGAGLSFQ
jgi:hypothetical protein